MQLFVIVALLLLSVLFLLDYLEWPVLYNTLVNKFVLGERMSFLLQL